MAGCGERQVARGKRCTHLLRDNGVVFTAVLALHEHLGPLLLSNRPERRDRGAGVRQEGVRHWRRRATRRQPSVPAAPQPTTYEGLCLFKLGLGRLALCHTALLALLCFLGHADIAVEGRREKGGERVAGREGERDTHNAAAPSHPVCHAARTFRALRRAARLRAPSCVAL